MASLTLIAIKKKLALFLFGLDTQPKLLVTLSIKRIIVNIGDVKEIGLMPVKRLSIRLRPTSTVDIVSLTVLILPCPCYEVGRRP